MPTITSKLLLLIMILSSSVVLGFQEWTGTLSAATIHSSFIVWGQVGQKMTIKIETQAESGYQVKIYRPGEYFPTFPAYESVSLKGTSEWESGVLEISGYWRAEVLPGEGEPMFGIRVEIDIGGVVGQYAEVARRKKLVVMYFQKGEECTFTLSDIAPSLAEEIEIELYQGIGTELDYRLGRRLYTNQGKKATVYMQDHIAAQTGYYYMLLSATEKGMALFPRVLLFYPTTNFPCPFPSRYLDANDVFSTCNSSTPLFPCVEHTESGQCGGCAEDYVLQAGECYEGVECGAQQYFDRGQCKKAISNCEKFQKIGGICHFCIDKFKLFRMGDIQFCYFDASQQPSSQEATQQQQAVTSTVNTPQTKTNSPPHQSTSETSQPVTTSPSPVTIQGTCGSGAYFYDGVCILYPAFCIGFDPVQQVCTRCSPTYTVNQFRFSCVPVTTPCSPSHTNINNQCYPYPSFCVITNAVNHCIRCDSLYTPSAAGQCIPKNCPALQYLTFQGACQPIEEGCDDFDRQLRVCIRCKPGYANRESQACVAVGLFEQTVTSCGPREYEEERICRKVDPLCDHFNVYTGKCLNCSDSHHLLDKPSGKCISVSKVCQEGYYFSTFTRRCQQVSPFCTDYNPINGFCLNCTQDLTLFKGNCLFLSPCARNEYRDDEGQCQLGPENCLQVSDYSNICMICKEDYEWNEGGLCCYRLNYLIDVDCRPLLKKNCKNFRESSGNCVECQEGYRQYNGILSKCLPN